MLPKIREFTSSSPIPSARVSTLTGASSSPPNCTSSVEMKKDTMIKFVVINKYHLHVINNFAQYLRVDARVIVIAITNVQSFILVSICYSFDKIYSKQDFDFLLLFDVKMYYYCEIIMYNIFCSIKNQLHISSIASRGQKFVLPRNTCIFP